MSYDPVTDFLALLRRTASGVENERMPGLDYIVYALARAGLFRLYIGQSEPIVNQPTTVWLKTALPSWTAEGIVFLWNSDIGEYQQATPALWNALLAPKSEEYSFQTLSSAAGVVLPGTSLFAIQRLGPLATAVVLPSLTAQFVTGRKLQLVDFSTAIAEHTITLSTPDDATIMQEEIWQLFSTPDQLAGVMLQPSPELNAWIIAP